MKKLRKSWREKLHDAKGLPKIAVLDTAKQKEFGAKTLITPWWRTLKSEGDLNPKYPGGLAAQRQLLAAEGHRIVSRGKRSFVADHINVLFAP